MYDTESQTCGVSDFEASLQRARALMDANDIDASMKEYHELLKSNPRCVALHNEVAVCYTRRNQWDTAVSHYRTSLSIDPLQKHADAICTRIGRLERRCRGGTIAPPVSICRDKAVTDESELASQIESLSIIGPERIEALADKLSALLNHSAPATGSTVPRRESDK